MGPGVGLERGEGGRGMRGGECSLWVVLKCMKAMQHQPTQLNPTLESGQMRVQT